MINFRFHIASLIAVFLALAVGVVMGSTVIQTAIVDGLHNQIDRVEKKADRQRDENAQLQTQVQQLQAFVDAAAPWTVAGRLTNPVATVAERGVDSDEVKAQAELLREAGAPTPAIMWLEDDWNLTNAKQLDALRTAIGSASRSKATVRREAEAALAARLTAGPVPGQPDLLDSLTTAGFISFERLDGGTGPVNAASYPGRDAQVLMLGGPAAQITVKTLPRDLSQALVERTGAPVVGEVFADVGGTTRGAWLAPIRSDRALSAALSTVDDVELTQGRIASTLALADVSRGIFGAYGYGSGATAPLPKSPTARGT